MEGGKLEIGENSRNCEDEKEEEHLKFDQIIVYKDGTLESIDTEDAKSRSKHDRALFCFRTVLGGTECHVLRMLEANVLLGGTSQRTSLAQSSSV